MVMKTNFIIENFYHRFNGEKGVIGKSERGKNIYYFAVKKTAFPKIIFTYSIHAREFITAHLGILQLLSFYKNGKIGSAYFVPLLNPDGVEICQTEKPLYKANANGVDLNVNFRARWGLGEKNLTVKGDENYIGKKPFSESESRAIRDFTLLVEPDMSVSYHSKGEEIYYKFHQDKEREKRDFLLAKKVAKVTKYKIKETPNSCGGYKDWCIMNLKIPSLTIEVGSDKLTHPIGLQSLRKIFNKNKKVVNCLMESL